MITDEQLKNLSAFGKESDGTYCDRWQFSIEPCNEERTLWNLVFFNEVRGSKWFIKKLKDMDDLRNVYHSITNSKLEEDEV